MSRKKIIIIVISLVVVAALVTGGIFTYRWYRSENTMVEVVPVSNLNWGYSGDEMSSYGMVTNDMSQDVYYLESQTIEEIFVSEGDTVAVGDPLISYDMTMSNLQLEMKELDIDTYSNKLVAAQKELERLRNTTPIPDAPVDPIVPTEPEQPVLAEKTGEAYNYISSTAVPNKGTGTIDDPYVFLCTPECYIFGEYLNRLSADASNPVFVIFEIHKDNTFEGELLTAWNVSGNSGLPQMEETSKWAVSTRSEVLESAGNEIPDTTEEEPPVPTGYTARELERLISEKEREIRELNLDKRKAELELEQMKKVAENGVVTATVNGIVKKVGDMENPPTDGSPFLTVSGSEGLYVSGSLSELMLGKVEVGQTVYANSWESGMYFEATITEISTYPQENNSFWGEGNPNVSYYPYTAYIEDTAGLRNGEYVDLTMTSNEDHSNSIYLQKAYIREENGRYYVLKADENNRLVKQYIVTGKTLWGQALEVVSGLTLEDRIAFPYGKDAREGAKVQEASGDDIYY
ncbi:MAG: efflux RND transporter periplasmic adaptor subunit [Bacteroides sp.]|nr:efflux RND transporter periplasmic adaptor subunit [Bacteroides sp.]MCM1549732.1 efflux RND transporter periplasmic adaptor subunit [Clostridium sp.]